MNLFLGHTKKGLKKFMEIHESRGCWPVKVHIDVEKFLGILIIPPFFGLEDLLAA